MDRSVHLLCKAEFSCDGDSLEDPSQGFSLFSGWLLGYWFRGGFFFSPIPPDFISRGETFYSYAFIIFVRVSVSVDQN